MRKYNYIMLTVAILSLTFLVAIFTQVNHIAKRSVYPARDYQIQLETDSTYLYSDGVLIGAVKSWTPCVMDTVIWFSRKGRHIAGYK